MPSSTIDALTSFTSLADQLPTWISTINHLFAHASKKHAQFAAEYSGLVSQSGPEKQRSPSISSIEANGKEKQSRPSHPQAIPSAPSVRPDATEIGPLEAGNGGLLAQISRKRKPASSIRSNASQPQRFRNRHVVVVYYDAHLQEQLNSLVKAVGGSRNSLRKGKLSRTLQNGLALPTISRRGGDIQGFQSPLKPDKMPTCPITNSDSHQSATTKLFDDATFDTADKQLELAQSLCETAAHQVLRDGDCAVELNAVREKFEAILNMANSSVKQLQAEKACNPDQPEPAESNMLYSPLLSPHMPPTVSKPTAPAWNDNIQLTVPNLASSTTEIEVDDESDDSSIVVDMSQFRAARVTGART